MTFAASDTASLVFYVDISVAFRGLGAFQPKERYGVMNVGISCGQDLGGIV